MKMDNVCRLCSISRNLVDAFDEQRARNLKTIRYVIWMATGVEIKETDKASKMVCQRCCEIAVKMYKYRTNALINDKLLKERCDQPYTAPVINQDEILRLSSEIVNEYIANIKQSNLTSGSSNSKTVSSHLLKQLSSSTNTVSNPTSKKHPSLRRNRIVREVAHRHPSICKLYKQYTDVILPVDVFKSDVSPVISLDSTEVSDWYAEQANNIQKRLTSIIIKKIPWESEVPSIGENLIPNDMQSSTDKKDFGNLNINTNNSNNDSKDINTVLFHCQKDKEQPPFTVAKNVPQRARKKTTRKIHSSRKRSIDDEEDEIIPEKKIRSFNNKQVKNASNKVDLPNQLPSDTKEQKTIFTSSLELTPVVSSPVDQISVTPSPSLFLKSTSSITTLPSLFAKPVTLLPIPKPDSIAPLFEQVDCQNVMAAEKTLSIFICSICNQLCDTKKELQDHEKIHLTCKFCKMRLRNLVLLQQHQNETCFINIVKNPPNLQLTRVDSIKSIVQKYSEAFEVLSENNSLYQDTLDNTNNDSVKDFEAVTNMFRSEMEVSASTSSQLTVCSDSQKVMDRTRQANSATLEIVSFLDEHREISKAIAKLPIKATVAKESATSSNKANVTSISLSKLNTSSKPQNYANEKEMIQSLFTKYNSASLKCNASSDTSDMPKNSIVCTNTNLIVLEDVLSELDKYKILVYFSFKPRVSAKFQEQPLVTEERILESWKNKTVIDVQRQSGSSVYIKTNPPNKVSLKLSNVTLNGTKVAITAQKDLLNKKRTNSPIVLNNSTCNKNTIVTEPAKAHSSHSLGQLSLVTLPTTSTAIIAQTSKTQNLSGASLILNPTSTLSNALPCPALYVPQSGALIPNKQQNEVIPVSTNVTSVGKYVVLTTSGVTQQLSGINVEYLKCSPLPAQKQTLQLQQNQISQQSTTVTPTTTATNATPPVKSQPTTIRVKSLWELTQ
ncbi:hypothetical protein ILUMI_00464 [Ignelater luminosus]|uniref:ZAD domain-containing protein n=1 Tax=Ignelater luminosus TaxID=2038154 RepID=A0A8K0GL74_IGNLU|nr:hypothetical protein ILUMI_00464 [Ignelater luminosus]